MPLPLLPPSFPSGEYRRQDGTTVIVATVEDLEAAGWRSAASIAGELEAARVALDLAADLERSAELTREAVAAATERATREAVERAMADYTRATVDAVKDAPWRAVADASARAPRLRPLPDGRVVVELPRDHVMPDGRTAAEHAADPA